MRPNSAGAGGGADIIIGDVSSSACQIILCHERVRLIAMGSSKPRRYHWKETDLVVHGSELEWQVSRCYHQKIS